MTIPGQTDDGVHTSPNATRRFSYFCLKDKDNLCLGISPGTGGGQPGHYIQLKPYGRNFYKGVEFKKMRWDIIPDNMTADFTDVEWSGMMKLEATTPGPLCVTRKGLATNVWLADCDPEAVNHWIFDQTAGVIRFADNDNLCLTVAQCQSRPDPAQSCDPTISQPELIDASEGAVIHLKPCFDSNGDKYIDYAIAQVFLRELDCVAGCASELNYNKRCDEICNNPVCADDKGECRQSPAPTPPPTDPPTFPQPTASPTNPPPIAVIEAPFGDNLAVPNYWWLLLLFLLLCCLATTTFLRRSRRKRRQRVFEEDSTFDDTEGPSGHSHLMSAKGEDAESDDENEEARFKTASAVALNQLRYHSRAATTSNSAGYVSGESVKRRPETSSNDRKYQFEEVGLV